MGRVFVYFKELRLNFTLNFLSFLLMRITGVGLVLYLFLHVWSIGHARAGTESFNAAMGAYNTPLFWVFEYLLLLAVLYHMFNGLRLIAADFLGLTERQSGMLWLAGLFIVSIGAGCAFVFFPGATELVRGFIQL